MKCPDCEEYIAVKTGWMMSRLIARIVVSFWKSGSGSELRCQEQQDIRSSGSDPVGAC